MYYICLLGPTARHWQGQVSTFKAQLSQLGIKDFAESCQDFDIKDGIYGDGNDGQAAYSQEENTEMAERGGSPSHYPREDEDPMIPLLEEGRHGWSGGIRESTARCEFGIVGSTGVGKSSLINAIADEENILATNCMHTSSAVATELSYNDGEFKYKARIEFIQCSEWEHELRVLPKEIFDSMGDILGENVPKDSNAGIALDKIKAVYLSLELENIVSTSVEKLLESTNVLSLLGTILILEENNPRVFSRKLKSYIDSKGRTRGPKRSSQKDSDIGLWPLVSVVRIYVKAKALSTGAMLVDLPDVFDSNPARVAVVED
ncbi:hypothetical protein BDV23DRAFT_182596 [Aspergillus alliaceus]|uniref:G domain-containing protein n=1 Tax=Petromyces alliaceus TaxID=209559 RepID=A0A5N7CAW9_PETAA|nr:hypothetical protein BDV23DRAFT_182596 [Aspergillus alliaceus]